jgi:dCMP deaminase
MPLANTIAQFSKDPNTKVGAVMIDKRGSVRSQGYNGFPRGVDDDPARYANHAVKLAMIAHAEANAIANAASVGIPLFDCSMVVTKFPCAECAKLVINAGISDVYAPRPEFDSKWYDSNVLAIKLFNEAGVEVWFEGDIDG